ncbi:unnamed protein product [Rotaria socialis]|uniref:RING-type domain-containing protein n=1 Tax=Rotaria socialis TaxID=392032 RepID=A0A819V2A4_9BILA|nr:unnamed protein product [Rotaria socialis]CAF4496783.1 unnamed protein product [Rotaria socialis]
MPKPSRRVMGKPEPLRFNELHGKGITLANNNRQATRSSGFGDAIVFSCRTVRSYEKVFLKHRQKEVDWIGSLRVGFCLQDPKTQFTQETLPTLAFKHLTDQGGYWLRACPDELLRTSPIIYVYYAYGNQMRVILEEIVHTTNGQIYVGGYGQTTPAQAVLTINEHNGPYYLFCEVYGKTDQIEIIDEATLPDQTIINEGLPISIHGSIIDFVTKNLNDNSNISQLQYFNYLYSSNAQHKLTFMSSTNHNVILTNNNRIACVDNLKIKSSYAFLNTPMKLNEMLICRVMNCDTNISSILLFGLTTCNPASLKNRNLPEDATALTEQYSSSKWFIDSDINADISMYDELAFWFDLHGHVNLSINNRLPIQLKSQIPSSEISNLTLYPFFDLYGQVTSIYLYNFSSQEKLDFNKVSNARELCLICHEHLADTQLLPCECILCNTCATMIKRPSLLSDCPFDRKHISQIRPLS